MKKTKKLLGIIALAAVIGFVFTALSLTGCDDDSHSHDFSGAWQKDATDHWKVCSADGEIGQKTAHTYGNNAACTECGISFAVGDTGPAGGIIFYVDAGGFTMTGIAGTCHYLEASPANLTGGTESQEATMKWSTASSVSPDAIGTLETIGSGKNNTAIIIAAESAVYPDNTYIYAARACSKYRGGGKDDWFLPSIYELIEMYKVKSHFGNPTGYFWSSSQTSLSYAVAQNFGNGNRYDVPKTTVYPVRAVRAF
jgi:hypothetical protein